MTVVRVALLGVAVASGLQLSPRCPTLAPLRAAPSVNMAVRFTDASGAEIKPAVSSYMHFCAERRASLREELKASMGAAFTNTEAGRRVTSRP